MKNSSNKEIYTDKIINFECDIYRAYITDRHDSITYIKCSDNFLEMLKNKKIKIHSISRKNRVYFVNKNISNYYYYNGDVLGIVRGTFNSLHIRRLSKNILLYAPRNSEKTKLGCIEFSTEDKKLMTKIKLAGLENYIKNC